MESLVGTAVGRYRVSERLGAGGMGEVYLAFDPDLRRDVAIKRVAGPFASDAKERRRLRDEARSIAGLSHPNIAGVYDLVEVGDELYVIMEYLPGVTLRQLLSAQDGVEDGRRIVRECAKAVSAAHSCGIVHRDLKASNVMVSPQGEIKVFDFGLAWHEPSDAGDSTTRSVGRHEATACGTPGYMAPEVLLGKGFDTRSDVFSLGVILYEVLTGEHPFRRRSAAATVDRVLNAQPASPSTINPGVDEEMDRVVARALAKDPHDRYADAGELLRDLEASEAGHGIRSDTPPSLRRKWWRVGAPAMAAAALIAVASTWLWVGITPPVSPGSTVMYAGLENRTTEGDLDGASRVLQDLLDQSAYYSLLSTQRVQETLAQMRVVPTEPLDLEVAREAAWRSGSLALVRGALDRFGDTYLVTVRVELIQGEPGEVHVLSETFRATTPDELFDALEFASRWVRETVGESSSALAEKNVPARQVTSSSWRAVDLYAEHFALRDRGELQQALAFLQDAVRIDPEFALAYARLGDLISASDRSAAYAYWQKALVLQAQLRLTEKETLSIEAHYAVDIGAYVEAVESFGRFRARFPHEHAAQFGHARTLATAGRHAEAIAAFEAILRSFPDDPYSLVNLAPEYRLQGRFEDADRVISRLESIRGSQPSWVAVAREERALTLFARGEAHSAERLMRENLQTPSMRWRSHGYLSLAALLAETARTSEAVTLLQEGIEFDNSNGMIDSAHDKQLATAHLALAGGDSDLAGAVAADVARDATDPDRLWRAASTMARAGDLEGAAAAARRVPEVEGIPLFEHAHARIQAELLLARGEIDAARRAFEHTITILPPEQDRLFLIAAVDPLADRSVTAGILFSMWAAPDRLTSSPGWRLTPGLWRHALERYLALQHGAAAASDVATAERLLTRVVGTR